MMRRARTTGWGTIIRWSNKCRKCPILKPRTYCSHHYHNCQNWTSCSTYARSPSAQTPRLHPQASTLNSNNNKRPSFKWARHRSLSQSCKSNRTVKFFNKRTWTGENSCWKTGRHCDYRTKKRGRRSCWGRKGLKPYAASWTCFGSGRGSSYSTVWTIGTTSRTTSRRSCHLCSRCPSCRSTGICSSSHRPIHTRAIKTNKTVAKVLFLATSI